MANDIGFNKNSRIQTLRGIAALSVVVDHTLTQFNIYYHLEGITGEYYVICKGLVLLVFMCSLLLVDI